MGEAVHYTAEAALAGATVEITGTSTQTDERGAFRLWTERDDTLTISIRRLGYSPIEALMTARAGRWDTVVVELEPVGQRLAEARVTAGAARRSALFRSFEERRAMGNGVFVTREEIAAQNTVRLSDILRTRRGITIVRISPNRYGIRFTTHTGRGRGSCIPDVWLDGQRVRGFEVDDLLANTVEAMELYDSFALVPAEFTHSAGTVPCGTIVIWTRVPGRP